MGGKEGPLVREDIDTSNGVMYIFYDPDTNVVYLAGKVGTLTISSYPFTVCLPSYQSSLSCRLR